MLIAASPTHGHTSTTAKNHVAKAAVATPHVATSEASSPVDRRTQNSSAMIAMAQPSGMLNAKRPTVPVSAPKNQMSCRLATHKSGANW